MQPSVKSVWSVNLGVRQTETDRDRDMQTERVQDTITFTVMLRKVSFW